MKISLLQLESNFSISRLFKHEYGAKVVAFVNPYSFIRMDKELSQAQADEVDFYFTDSMLMQKASNFVGNKVSVASFDFSSIASKVFDYAQERNLPIAIIGGRPCEIKKFNNTLQHRWPNLQICFSRHGFDFNEDSLMNDIVETHPSIVLLGLGSPLQERLAIRLKSFIKHKSVIFTCGGFISQTAIKPDYYHPIIIKLNMRWMQRFFLEKHTRSRIVKEYALFIYKFICFYLRTSKK